MEEAKIKMSEKMEWIKTHHHALVPFKRFKEKASASTARLFMKRKGALYVHVPFCLGTCKFCILYHEYPSVPYKSFVNALIREMKKYRSFKAKVVYFGGGTPTTFLPESSTEFSIISKERRKRLPSRAR